jgi:hypothetical protein
MKDIRNIHEIAEQLKEAETTFKNFGSLLPNQ